MEAMEAMALVAAVLMLMVVTMAAILAQRVEQDFQMILQVVLFGTLEVVVEVLVVQAFNNREVRVVDLPARMIYIRLLMQMQIQAVEAVAVQDLREQAMAVTELLSYDTD